MRSMKLLGVVLVGGLALAACGKSSNSSSAGKYSSSSAPSSSTVAGSGSTAPAGSATVSVATGAIAAHLVGSDGHTLYLFEKDQGTTSACTAACADIWPAVVATAPTGATGIDASELSTATGQKPNQVVYNGHLLYEYSGDHAAGDTNGTKIPSWYAVTPAGASLEGTLNPQGLPDPTSHR